MYATVQNNPTGSHDTVEQIRLERIAGPGGLAISLWDQPPSGTEAYLVENDQPLADAGKTPEYASVVTFSGPVSQAVRDAAQYASTERIMPALTGHPGGVRVLGLWQPELRRQIIVTLATSIDALEEGGRKIASMPLLPGEDVALLPGPDHVELFRVQS